MMISSVVSRLAILTFGTIYPAYSSFKAVRAKNVTEYVKWMMYWIVFAIFSCIETFTDLLLPWFPFYYEIKVVLVLWLLSPATNGSSILYRKFVHPLLKRKEPEIDGYIVRLRQQGYATFVQLLTQGIQCVRAFVSDILHGNFNSGVIVPNENVLRSSVSNGSLNARHYFGENIQEVPRSQSLHFMHRQDLIITEESTGDDSAMSSNMDNMIEDQQPSASSTTTRSKTANKARKAAANKNIGIVRRGRGRKVKEAITDSATEEEH